jgi:hypothetical protein
MPGAHIGDTDQRAEQVGGFQISSHSAAPFRVLHQRIDRPVDQAARIFIESGRAVSQAVEGRRLACQCAAARAVAGIVAHRHRAGARTGVCVGTDTDHRSAVVRNRRPRSGHRPLGRRAPGSNVAVSMLLSRTSSHAPEPCDCDSRTVSCSSEGSSFCVDANRPMRSWRSFRSYGRKLATNRPVEEAAATQPVM